MSRNGSSSLLIRLIITLSLVTKSSWGPGNWPLIRITFKISSTKTFRLTKSRTKNQRYSLAPIYAKKRLYVRSIESSYITHLLRSTKRRKSSISYSPCEVFVCIFCLYQRHTQQSQSNSTEQREQTFASHHYVYKNKWQERKTSLYVNARTSLKRKGKNAGN